jgi:hypothetical protein
MDRLRHRRLIRRGGGPALVLAAVLAFAACHPQEPPVRRDGLERGSPPAAARTVLNEGGPVPQRATGAVSAAMGEAEVDRPADGLGKVLDAEERR